MHSRHFVASLLALALTMPAPAAAASHGRTELRTIAVHTQYRMPPATMDAPACDGPAEAPCYLRIHGTETMTGTFAATGNYTGRVWPHTAPLDGDMGFDGFNYMTGTIVGCGTGSFTYQDVNGTLFTSNPDPFTQSVPAKNDWIIVPGSLTGQLAERFVSGSGSQEWRSYPFNQDAAQENWGGGVITGTVTCRVPVRNRRR